MAERLFATIYARQHGAEVKIWALVDAFGSKRTNGAFENSKVPWQSHAGVVWLGRRSACTDNFAVRRNVDTVLAGSYLGLNGLVALMQEKRLRILELKSADKGCSVKIST
jgi:hypothetical protein